MSISTSDRILAEIDGATGWITVNNPERRNAISEDMLVAMCGVLENFANNPQVRVILLTGAGDKSFIAGADISEFAKQRSSADAAAAYAAKLEEARCRLDESSKPTIAMINGYCIGLGLNLALVCDLRLASESARFSVPAARMGHGYSWPALKRLNDMVGHAFTREILLTGRQFDAAEAGGMGLVNRVVKAEELLPLTRSYCTMIGENAPLTMAAAKGALRALLAPASSFDRAECERLTALCFASDDYVEGQNSFREKRKAVFHGK